MLRDKGTPAAFHRPDLNGSTLAVVELCHLKSARAYIITPQVQLQRVTLERAQDEVVAKFEHDKLVKQLENMERTMAQSRQRFAAKVSKIAHLEARIDHMRQQQRLPTQDASGTSVSTSVSTDVQYHAHLLIQKFLQVMRSNVESFPDKILNFPQPL